MDPQNPSSTSPGTDEPQPAVPVQSDPAVPLVPPADPQPPVMPDPGQQSEPSADANAASSETEGNYMTNVGQSMVDLLTHISTSDAAKQKIADEMGIGIDQVVSLCNGLLDKYDSGTLTEEELAFLITAPVGDTTTDQGSSV